MTAEILTILERVLGSSYKTPKNEYLFHCPFCRHHKKKLSVNLGHRFGSWKCWVCNVAGKKVTSLLHKANAPQEYITRVRELDPAYVAFSHTPTETTPSKITLPVEYQPLYHPVKTEGYRSALSYLLRRGITIHDILKYKIGYCENGPYANRVIVPSYDAGHDLNYFVARSYKSVEKLKYKNPPVSKNIIIFENFICWELPVVLVEGVFDAMTVRHNTIPLLGKLIGSTLLKKLIEKKPPIVHVLLDTDAQEDAYDLCDILKSYGLNVKNVTPTEKDANEMGNVEVWKQINQSEHITFKDVIMHKLYA